MTVIYAHELNYRYSQTAIPPDDPRRTGFPDSVLLNRSELYEVLNFLNRFCRDTRYLPNGPAFGKAEALKAERALQTTVPGSIRSHAGITDWLRANWGSLR